MTREIVQIGHPVLRRPARELSIDEIRSEAIRELVEAMRETMRAAPGVGLAAPQIGEPLRLAVVEDREEYTREAARELLLERERAPVPFQVLVNPRLTVEEAETVEFFEGCLSLEGFVGLTPRALAVRVDCLDENANPLTIRARGWHARILQHEIDHLDGRLYVDRIHPRTLMTAANHGRWWAGRSAAEIREALALSISPCASSVDPL